jgi:ribosome-associated protein
MTTGPDGLQPASLADEIIRHALGRKAENVVELDLTGLVDYTDYFVIVTARSDRQAKAISDAIAEGLGRDHGINARKIEGLPEGRWVLADYVDVVVHIFQQEARDIYRLEKLWSDAPQRVVTDEPTAGPADTDGSA